MRPQIKIQLNLKNVTMTVGESVILEVKSYPYNQNQSLTWFSSNENIAKVDRNGRVTALKAGDVIIKATINEEIFDECIVKIEPEKIDINQLDKCIISSPVAGTITRTTNMYSDFGARYRGVLQKGTRVEVLEDRNFIWYYVKTEDKREGWIRGNSLNIIQNNIVLNNKLTKDELEYYVNSKGFTSPTNYNLIL